VINFGSVDDPATTKMLNALASRILRPGEIDPISPVPMQDSTCEHCGQIIVRCDNSNWKHYPSLKEECHPRPTASPKRGAMGNPIPLTGK
jgi:hypothetical protein